MEPDRMDLGQMSKAHDGVSPCRALDGYYRSFPDLAAGQLGALVAEPRSWETALARAQKLAGLDRAKTELLPNISHEFRTPLTLIIGVLDELRAAAPGAGDPATQENLDVMHRNPLRLGKLASTLLDFARIEAGRMEASYEPVDLAALTAGVAASFRAVIEKAGLSFEVDCPALGEPVHVDWDMWEKVVLNLLSNALKYTFEGFIRVSLRREPGDPGCAVLRVADSGTGIAEPDLPHLFERFHRVYQARSRSQEGSGIGLALVHELIGLHGGAIAADSVVGKGTTFTVRLPLGSAHLPADRLAPQTPRPGSGGNAAPYVLEALRWSRAGGNSLPPAWTDPGAARPLTGDGLGAATLAAPGPPDGAPCRVLVTGDNADMREYLQRLLSPAYLVHAVGDGESALAAARAEHPELIISDVVMPGMDGPALLSALRRDQATETIPVLLLSARAGQDAAVEGRDAGSGHYLAKPFTAGELVARVRSTVELSRLRLHESRFRRALIESLEEGFFVYDEQGVFLDVNDVFGEIVGYGPEGLPYPPPYPWEPDPVREPELRRVFDTVVQDALATEAGQYTCPIRRPDGRVVWCATTVRSVPDWGGHGRVFTGTVRDVTAEREAADREAAVTRLAAGLLGATDIGEVLHAGLAELRQAFGANRAVAAVWPPQAPVSLAGVPAVGSWPTLDEAARTGLEAARSQPAALMVTETGGDGHPASVAARLDAGGGEAAIWLDRGGRSQLSFQDRVLFSLLSAHLGNALARAIHYEQARDLSLALQQSLLGQQDLAAGFGVRYEPAMRPLEVGGDWYDVTRLDHGRMGVVVGDCVGRGLGAAVIMGQLRSACRALLLRNDGPAQVLADLDRFADGLKGAQASTVFCAIIDAAAGTVTYSSAGHPPAILAHPGGTQAQLLDQATSVPLAVPSRGVRTEATAALRPGSALLFYTDGLVERRRERLELGIRKAADVLQQHADSTPDELADRVLVALAPAGGSGDDILVLTYRQPPTPLRLTLSAVPASLAGMRRSLRLWLAASGVPLVVSSQVTLAASEACSNAIEHAYGGDPAGQVTLTADIRGSRLDIVVADTSTWKPSVAGGGRGQGLPMMRTFMDDVVLEPSARGTTVRMSRTVR
jgi:PAS domain S-box-containing protein